MIIKLIVITFFLLFTYVSADIYSPATQKKMTAIMLNTLPKRIDAQTILEDFYFAGNTITYVYSVTGMIKMNNSTKTKISKKLTRAMCTYPNTYKQLNKGMKMRYNYLNKETGQFLMTFTIHKFDCIDFY